MTSLTSVMSTKQIFEDFEVWIVGDTPLITHAWSEKARREMLAKQVKATRGGKEARDPQTDFVNSLYEMGDGIYGFPATGIKNCILSAAHKDKGLARTQVAAALWIGGDMVRTRPALAGAVCDMPLVRIYGSAPECREDMVRVGAGLNKTATLAYRGQFRIWAMRIKGRLNASVMRVEALAFLITEAGLATGIGEWRNERRGMLAASISPRQRKKRNGTLSQMVAALCRCLRIINYQPQRSRYHAEICFCSRCHFQRQGRGRSASRW